MSKILLINGSPNEHGCTAAALTELSGELLKNGVETELLWLGKAPISDCLSCRSCKRTGRCAIDDGVNALIDRLGEFDGITVGTPVYFGGASGRICAFLDRLFYAAGDKMTGKLGAAVVSCRRAGATAAFQRLNMYFGISNMLTVGSQYWNEVHGNTAAEVELDAEGLQTMRTLGANMAWLLHNLEAGRKEGVAGPRYERRTATNFIR